MKKTIYISGKITGNPDYYKEFERAEEELRAAGYIALNPSRLPEGMSEQQYMQINLAQMFAADAVLMLPSWDSSRGATLENSLCQYIKKPFTNSVDELDEMFWEPESAEAEFEPLDLNPLLNAIKLPFAIAKEAFRLLKERYSSPCDNDGAVDFECEKEEF